MNKFEWERHLYPQAFNGEALRVLGCYASHADADTLITFPTVRGVADITRISVEKVGRYRRELLATGWLKESNEKTTRGNPKLKLGVGEDIPAHSYLGVKKVMNPKSMSNLVPAAKQKKARSLDTPDETGLEHREEAGLEHREVTGLDTPDVTTSELNNHYETTSNNQKDVTRAADATLITSTDPLIRQAGVLDSFNMESLTFTDGATYVVTTEGITRLNNEDSRLDEEARRAWLMMHDDERAFFDKVDCTPEQKDEAMMLYRSGDIRAWHWTERADKALVMAGVERPEPW